MRLSLALISALLLLAGCQAFEKHVYAGYSAPPLNADAVNSSNAVFIAVKNLKLDGTQPLVPEKCFSTQDATDAICRAARNQTVAILSTATETLCLEHRRSIYGRDAGANVALGTLTNLFAGSAAIATGGQSQAILGALALFSNSERSLMNETVYKMMIVTAVDDKIVGSMSAQADQIRKNLDLSIDKYGMAEAVTDVIHLHASCSFMEGLRLALSEGTRSSTTAKILSLRKIIDQVRSDVDSQCATPSTTQTVVATKEGGTSSATSTPPADAASGSAQASVAAVSPPMVNADAAKARCDLAKARFKAVSDRLSALEVSSD